ncbi:kynureninase [Ornithinimicrobium pekingense]|uniref:kynureninase n=1 Tax=Ornithinimicrobium pekingense TaxID=384677 RepID=UPI000492C65F|nr:aminotransferase class V-fold PLP-dependent enzyme [Ornithinimicrobium pekingense]
MTVSGAAPTRADALALDAADPLGGYPDRFERAEGVVAYFDGNSLGRPVAGVAEAMAGFVRHDWGTRLIRSWDEGWMRWPEEVGDLVGRVALGAAPGQTVVADSTTVLLYKLLRALADHQRALDPARTEIVLDRDNFPSDRYVAEGVAAERGMALRWIEVDTAAGVTPEQVAEVVGPATAVVLLSHVAYRSGWVADAEEITRLAHDAGALVLWDTCHSAGSVPVRADDWGWDAAVGCDYKYLGGGPGAPAHAYLAARLHDLPTLRQPVQGWMGRRDPFAMAQGYEPEPGVRSLVSGTPPVVGMVPLRLSLQLLEEAGIEAVRTKSLRLTDLAWAIVEDWPAGTGVTVGSPREHARRGGHITLRHPDFQAVNQRLWERGVIPDFRAPDGLRLGLAPLSTRFTEVWDGLAAVREELERLR